MHKPGKIEKLQVETYVLSLQKFSKNITPILCR